MTTYQLRDLFEKHDELFMAFEFYGRTGTCRPDLAAFILLDQLCPATGGIVIGAINGEIVLNIDQEELAKVITEDQVIELIRCGVRYDDQHDSLCMFT